jgi:hypothetical protein
LKERFSVYVPARTRARCPAVSVLRAFWTERHGAERVPAFESEPVVAT